MKLVMLFTYLWLSLLPVDRFEAQNVPPIQTFDTISIRPGNPEDRSFGYDPNPNNFQAKGVDLRFLVQLAYGTNANDISGIMPAFRTLRFDIHAKSDVDPASPTAKLRYSSDEGRNLFEARLKSLLAERFQLKLHHATADRPVLNLEVTRHLHLVPAANQNPMQSFGPNYLKFDSASMSELAFALTGRLMTDVIDHTGVTGVYALEVKWEPTDRADPLTYPFSAVSDAMSDQLGLKLVPAKASVPILVIDSATMPSPN